MAANRAASVKLQMVEPISGNYQGRPLAESGVMDRRSAGSVDNFKVLTWAGRSDDNVTSADIRREWVGRPVYRNSNVRPQDLSTFNPAVAKGLTRNACPTMLFSS